MKKSGNKGERGSREKLEKDEILEDEVPKEEDKGFQGFCVLFKNEGEGGHVT